MSVPAFLTGSVFSAGLGLGVSIAAPVGPMALLCINRTLRSGLRAGLATGLGIATGDAAYGAIAAFGFSAVTGLMVAYAVPLRIVGGAFLVWLGVQAWRMAGVPKQPRAGGAAGEAGLGRIYLVSVGLTLTNPATVLAFLAGFAALGLAALHDGAWAMVAGVFVGSALWWAAMCAMIATARRALTQAAMVWIDRLSALLLVGFGAAAAAGLL